MRFAYDADGRVLKTVMEPLATPTHTLDVFPTLRVSHTTFDGTDYARTSSNEVLFLAGVARVVVGESDLHAQTSGHRHVFFELPDFQGSVAAVIDGETSELVERRTTQAFGAMESDYRPERWDAFLAENRYTGKEDDLELGLIYFGARYYSPYLDQWISPDPLTIHELGANPNPYAMVSGNPLTLIDPDGLSERGSEFGCLLPGLCWGTGGGGGGQGGTTGGSVSGGATGGGPGAKIATPPRPPPPPPPPVPRAGGVVGAALGALRASGLAASPTVQEAVRLARNALVRRMAMPKTAVPQGPSGAPMGPSAGAGSAVMRGLAWMDRHQPPGLKEQNAFWANAIHVWTHPSRWFEDDGSKVVYGMIPIGLSRGPVFGRETISTFGGLNEARSASRLAARLSDDAVPFVQEIGPYKGRITGMQSPDGLRGWRVDYDAGKGYHVNWWDRSGGARRANWRYGANIIEGGTQDDFWQFMQHVP